MNTISPRFIIHNKIFYFSCLALAFMIPIYGRAVPPVIFLMVINWLIDGRFLKILKTLFQNPKRWRTLSFAAIYILYLCGMLYSADYTYGWLDLGIKSSLFLFPLIFATVDESAFDFKKIRYFFLAFVSGCVLGSLILLTHSFLELQNGIQNPFFYSNFSWSFHPSYYAMYLVIAITCIADYLFFSRKKILWEIKAILSMLVLFFFVIIFLLSSKAGIASLVIITVFYIFILLVRKRMLTLGIILIVAASVCYYCAFKLFPFAMERISQTGNVDLHAVKSNSSAERIEIWTTALIIIKQHFLTGVGTGDTKDELLKKYKERNLQNLYLQKLNAHNQFLQTFISIGIFGFLALLATYCLPAIGALRTENYLYFVFILIFCFNNLVESMLEIQAGVVFYAFFNAFLYWTSSDYKEPVSLPVVN